MGVARKTVDVSNVRAAANNFLLLSDDDKVGERLGVASLLEQVLHNTGNYRGFRYHQNVTPDHPDFDESRRIYYG